MDGNTVFKIKDSVDIFLNDEKYIVAYYMNTRQRKSFRINDKMICLIQSIDGEKCVYELQALMKEQYNIQPEMVLAVLEALHNNRIITEVKEDYEILSKTLIEKYSRQINYFAEFFGDEENGIIAQKRLIDSHVVVFGCGAVGGNIVLELAMAGVGCFTLYDFDIVEESDVARHMYFKKEDVGEYKVELLRRTILEFNPNATVRVFCESMNPQTNIEGYIQGTDFVVNTMDEPYIGYTSSKISRVCMKYKVPHFIAGGFDAHLASTGELIIPYITPCVECYAGHFKETLKGWKPKGHPVKERYSEIGGIAAMTLFSSSYACIEIIKYLAGLISMEDQYKARGELLFDDLKITYLDVNKNPACPICGRGDGLNES